ncbi:MAG: hypothetical protein WBW78_11630 [Terrimicrobiaceae bacterium]
MAPTLPPPRFPALLQASFLALSWVLGLDLYSHLPDEIAAVPGKHA